MTLSFLQARPVRPAGDEAMRAPGGDRGSTPSTAYLFPGQGSYYPGALRGVAPRSPAIAEVLSEMDGPANDLLGVSISEQVLIAPPRPLPEWVDSSPDVLQLLLVAVGIATYRALRAEGAPDGLLIGHSLGELAALAAAGVLTPTQASEIVCRRALAIRHLEPAGRMVAVNAPAHAVAKMLDLIGDDQLAIAVVNTDAQTVVSGPPDALETLATVAAAVRIPTMALQSPYAFHSPVLRAASSDLRERIAHIRPGRGRSAVYSPILGRCYRDEDDITSLVASHLVMPVRFATAIRQVRAAGVSTFVESGAMDVLTKLVRRILDEPDVVTVAPLADRGTEIDTWTTALSTSGILRSATPTVAHSVDDIVSVRDGLGDPSGATPPPVLPVNPVNLVAPVDSGSLPRSAGAAADRAAVLRTLTAMYAQALEYPEEVFAQDTDLEAELGVDSVKQTELLARVSAHFELPTPDETFRLSHYGTLARIADLVCAGPATDRGTAAPAEPVVLKAVPTPVPASDRAEILRTLTAMYAQALEYPEEVFAQDTDLEAELGVDSVKQTELLARVSAHYELPTPDETFRLSHYGTLARIADLVQFSTSRPELISA